MKISTLEEAVRTLQRGGVIILPTETIYGLGCLATNEDALRRLFEIKGRAPDKAPPVLVSNQEQLDSLVSKTPPGAARLIEKHWPGALTLVLPARDELSPILTSLSADKSTRTVGVRMTPHPTARALCEAAGAPIVATSANFSGATGRAATPSTLDDVAAELKELVDAIVDGGVLGGEPSTVVDGLSNPPRVLRAGAVRL